MEKVCEKCGKRFKKSVFRSLREWKKTRFCSHSCANSINSLGNKHSVGRIPWSKGKKFGKSPRNTQRQITCLQCGSVFTVKAYRIRDGVKFCSYNCKNKNQDMGLTPKHERLRKSRDYAIWRTAVFMRDDFTCQCCGQKGGSLHADHIKSFAHYPELRLAIDNGRTLCIECHKQTETYGNRKVAVVAEA